MNRILFERDEIRGETAVFSGERASHVLKILHGEVGQILKTGEVGGKIGTSEILEIGETMKVRVCHETEALGSWCDLILAPPRPRVMKRLLPNLATLGVGKIYLVGARKVEKDFWGATLLKEANYRPLFIDGLMQGGVATELPVIETRRNFRAFVNDELESLFPMSERILAHPPAGEAGSASIEQQMGGASGKRPLFAIGPEGGWTDEEVALLEAHNFDRCSLGRRILRTDTAVVALLTRFMMN